MDANLEVMPAVAPQPGRSGAEERNGSRSQVADPSGGHAHKARRAQAAGPRVSVDPMRPTDRYRLVMPYSLRV